MSNFIKHQFSIGPTFVSSIFLNNTNTDQLTATAVKPLEMGLSLATLLLVYLPCAISMAQTTCTITLLRSLADQGGAFDVPKGKCPPDRGSSVCVTGSRAQSTINIASFDRSASSESKFAESIIYPPTPPADQELSSNDYMSIPLSSSPTDIPRPRVVSPLHQLVTPPLSPDNSDNEGANDEKQFSSQDASDFLLTIFPREGGKALPYAKSVTISAPNVGAIFDGVVLELPGTSKALYVDGKSAQSVSLRERYVQSLMYPFISTNLFVFHSVS